MLSVSPGEPALTSTTESTMSSLNTIPATEAADCTNAVTHWVSEDQQGEYDMGGMTAAEALAELLAQCGTDEQRAGILDGHFVLAADTSFLDAIDEATWERVCGSQDRTEFASLAIDQGQTIEDAWAEALAHAESL